MKKIAIVLNDDFSMYHFFGGLISALVAHGHDVYVLTPNGPSVCKIEDIGAKHIAVPMNRFFSPLLDLKLFVDLYKIFKKEKFDIIHNITIKPNIYGSVAAKLAGCKKILSQVEGAGMIFMNGLGINHRFLAKIAKIFYRYGLKFSHKVRFLNIDDLNLFTNNTLTDKSKTLLIRSSGINMSEYSKEMIDTIIVERAREYLCITDNAKVITLITARMIWSKGIREFVEAAEIMRDKHPNIIFLLIGPLEKNAPDAIPEAYLITKNCHNLCIDYTFRTDIREIISLSDIIVLPSYYNEGVPRILLEAMAMCKPIVTTDNTGCREVIDDGKNGYLIPIKDSVALVNCLIKLIYDPIKCKEFGKNSRLKAEKEFSEDIIIKKIMNEFYVI